MTALPALAYKVLTADQWQAFCRDGRFAGAPVDLADGYVHLSTAEQVTETVNRHFAGQIDLHLCAIDLAPLGDAVKWEPSRGGSLFPHVYAALPLSAVVADAQLSCDELGSVVLPTPAR